MDVEKGVDLVPYKKRQFISDLVPELYIEIVRESIYLGKAVGFSTRHELKVEHGTKGVFSTSATF